MKKFQIVRIERLKSMSEVKRSGLHTFREIDTKNAISEKFSENEFVGAKDAEGVFQAVRTRIGDLDKKDKQACRCLEFFVSASPEQFLKGGLLHDPEKQKQYFAESLDFIKKKHGEDNVVFHAIHKDEKTPHMVVYAVPVVHREAKTRIRSVSVKKSERGGPLDEGNGRRTYTENLPARTELSAKAFYHCPAALALLQDEFHAGVSKAFGLDRGISRAEAQKHKKTWVYYAEKNAEIKAGFAALAADRAALAAEAEIFDVRLSEIRGQLAAIENSKQMLRGESMALGEERRGLETEQKALVDGQSVLVEKIQAVEDREKEIEKLRDDLSAELAKEKSWTAELIKKTIEMDRQSLVLTEKLQDVEKLRVELAGTLKAAQEDREKAAIELVQVKKQSGELAEKITAVNVELADAVKERSDLGALKESVKVELAEASKLRSDWSRRARELEPREEAVKGLKELQEAADAERSALDSLQAAVENRITLFNQMRDAFLKLTGGYSDKQYVQMSKIMAKRDMEPEGVVMKINPINESLVQDAVTQSTQTTSVKRGR